MKNGLEKRIEVRSLPWIVLLGAIAAYMVLLVACPLAQSNQDTRRYLSFGTLFVGLTGLAHYTFPSRCKAVIPAGLRLQHLAFVLPAYAFFQVLPLPVGLVRILSPARAGLADALGSTLSRPLWVPLSVAPSSTVFHGLVLLACAIIFSLVYRILGSFSNRPWTLVVPLFAIALVEACLGLLQVASTSDSGVTGTFSIRNHYAGFLELVFPFAVVYSFKVFRAKAKRELGVKEAFRMCLGGAMAILIFAAILCSLSRMGFAASLFSLLGITFGVLLRHRSRKKSKAALISTTALLIFVLIMPVGLIRRFGEIQKEGRAPIWQETVFLIRDYPLWGCGLGGYLSAFVPHKQSAPSVTQDYAHNDYLQYFSELGLIGFTAAAVSIVIILGGLRKAWMKGQPEIQWLSLACAGSLTAIALHSFVDFNLYVPANMITLAWILGIAAYCGASCTEGRSREKTPALTTLA